MVKTLRVSRAEMIREHKRLVKELRRVGLKKEAREQAKELKEMMK